MFFSQQLTSKNVISSSILFPLSSSPTALMWTLSNSHQSQLVCWVEFKSLLALCSAALSLGNKRDGEICGELANHRPTPYPAHCLISPFWRKGNSLSGLPQSSSETLNLLPCSWRSVLSSSSLKRKLPSGEVDEMCSQDRHPFDASKVVNYN